MLDSFMHSKTETVAVAVLGSCILTSFFNYKNCANALCFMNVGKEGFVSVAKYQTLPIAGSMPQCVISIRDGMAI